QAGLVQADCVKTDRVFGIVFTPFVERQFLNYLYGVVVAVGEAALDELPCCLGGVGGAQIGGLQNRPQDPLRCCWIAPHVILVADQHAGRNIVTTVCPERYQRSRGPPCGLATPAARVESRETRRAFPLRTIPTRS